MAQQRAAIAERLEKLKHPRAKQFARFLHKDEELGLIPCWGAIAKRFEREFTDAADRVAIWRTLVTTGDRSALLLFLRHNLSQPDVLAQIVEDAPTLPESVQAVLVCLDEARGLVEARLSALSPAAQQLWNADEDTKRRERMHFESITGKMTSIDYIPPEKSAGTPPEKSPGAPPEKSARTPRKR